MQNAEYRMQNAKRHGRRSAFRAQRSRGSGFTLIELIVAVGLMAIMMTMVIQVFGQAQQSFNMGRASVEAHQNARAAFHGLLNDFTAAEYCQYGASANGYFAIRLDTSGYPAALSSGTATDGGANTLDNSDADWPVNGLAGAYVWLTGGAGSGQVRKVHANTETSLTVDKNWATVPASGSTAYSIGYPAFTLTTLAPQPGARYSAPEAVHRSPWWTTPSNGTAAPPP